MKRTNFMLLLVFALAGIFVTTTSCKAERGMQNSSIDNAAFTTVQVSSFDKMKFNGPVTLTLAQGNKQKVEYSDPKHVVTSVKVEGDHLLLVTMDEEKLKSGILQSGDIQFRITTPDLKEIKVNGPLHGEIGKMNLDNLTIKANGPASMHLEELTCRDLAITLNGPGSMEGNVKGGSVKMTYNGPANADIHVETDNCNLTFNGPTTSEVAYKGNDARVVLNGPGTLSLDVDCEKLKSVCNGVGTIKVKGTANDSQVNMNAIGRIDTSELNKL